MERLDVAAQHLHLKNQGRFNDEVVSPSQTPAEGGSGFSWSNMFRFTW